MEELLVILLLSGMCIFTYLISYIFIGISVIIFAIILMGVVLFQNNFLLFFTIFIMSGLFILRILNLKYYSNHDLRA